MLEVGREGDAGRVGESVFSEKKKKKRNLVSPKIRLNSSFKENNLNEMSSFTSMRLRQ